ncbi:DUF7521 family protein [Halomarina rubra]|uniref:Uncharacterized protein n=1 Tax=Halomarina rubra TaxID=2071873 RepID=A0ABD6B1G0_9EURY|nr:hypothetical protein [Halomarina rubra]
MNGDLPLVALVFKTATLLLGGLVAVLAYRAYRTTRAEGLWLLAVGFGTVTIGAFAAGTLDQFANVDHGLAITVESGLTALGFGVIAYSLYRRE